MYKNETPRAGSYLEQVLNYLKTQAVGSEHSVQEVQVNTGLTEHQVQGALSQLKLKYGVKLMNTRHKSFTLLDDFADQPVTLVPAPDPNTPDYRVFELVRTLKDGRAMIQDCDGVLYVATKLDI